MSANDDSSGAVNCSGSAESGSESGGSDEKRLRIVIDM
jgi:hypothetical protein